MKNENYIYLAQSLDGFIADKDGGLDWLEMIPNPEQIDMGYTAFINKIDAIIMGRNTFEKVLSFRIDWPYSVPVLVVSRALKTLPEGYEGKVEIVSGTPMELIKLAKDRGYYKLYIDGGKTVQAFLKEDLIDEITITTMPIILGGGIPLFGELSNSQTFKHVKTEVFLDELVQSNYKRIR